MRRLKFGNLQQLLKLLRQRADFRVGAAQASGKFAADVDDQSWAVLELASVSAASFVLPIRSSESEALIR